AVERRQRRGRIMRTVARIAEPRTALVVLVLAGVTFVAAAWHSRDRVVGTLQAGAPELRADARFNRDAVSIASSYDTGLDWMSVVFEAAPGTEACSNVAIGAWQNRFVWSMQAVPGVQSISSYAGALRQYNEGYNEGNP